MRKGVNILIAATAVGTVVLTGCSSSSKAKSSATSAGGSATSAASSAASSAAATTTSTGGGALDGKGAKVGIILPDTTSSPRWITADPTALKADCKKDNLVCDIQNANGSAGTMKTIAQGMEAKKIKVLMIVNLDPASGAAIEKAAEKQNIITVDYDRLTPGGGASLYVSFNNVTVGETQGQTLVNCPQVKGKSAVQYAQIDGAATDNNATLFKQGYESVLTKTKGWTKVSEQNGNWDAPTAGREFGTILAAHPKVKAVMVANDTMAGAVVADLKNSHLAGQVAVSGQDATAVGLQRIMDGTQCFTIYKPTTAEAGPAIDAIAQLLTGKTPKTNGTVTDPTTKKAVPSILAKPIAITKANVALPVNQQYVPKNTVCTAAYVAKCKANGFK
jgi:D-xylose transport system substrate-binding protein